MDNKFPDNFLWGAASSANQSEGGYKEGGKGLTLTDVFPNASSGRFEAMQHFDEALHKSLTTAPVMSPPIFTTVTRKILSY